jgi:hypothetical protein
MFLAARKGSFPPRFTTHSTTFSPSKNHVQPPTFSKTPLKNPAKRQNPAPSSAQDFF